MSFYSRGQNDLELENAMHFIEDLQTLDYFVKNVPIKTPNLNYLHAFNEVSKAIIKSFDRFKIKCLKLWMQFIQRSNSEYMGITSVHLALLIIIRNQNLFKLALELVQLPGLPIHISITKYKQYLIVSAQIYLELERYSDAYECLSLANSIEDDNFQVSYMALKMMVLICKIVGYNFDKKDFQKDMNKIKVGCYQNIQQIGQNHPQKVTDMTFEYEIFSLICQDKQLNSHQIEYLQSKELYSLYRKVPTTQMKNLKSYINKQIIDQSTFRLKLSTIQQYPIHEFTINKAINKVKPIYKSDPKNQIMYFNHRKQDQYQLDSMINKACEMKHILKNRPIEAKSQYFQRSENPIFGRMGGMR